MTQKWRVITTAVALVCVFTGTGFAVAQSERTTAVKEGAVTARPPVVQRAPVATVGPVSRPGKFGALGVQDSISVALTVTECTNLGGKVDDVSTKTCASGKQCATADRDGVIRTTCIDHKEN